MYTIVITNDDGVHAPGINILRETLKSIAQVIIVAPMTERSTTGHTLTLDTTLRLEEIDENIFACSGFPADCSLMAIGHLFKNPKSKYFGKKIDLLISGINRGGNLGQDIFYSGTVAAAREACFHGVPSIAISSCISFKDNDEETKPYYTASNFIKNLISYEVSNLMPQLSFLNINVPWCIDTEIKGVQLTRPGFRKYSEDIDERLDFRGRNYYWIGGNYKGFEPFEGSDCVAVENKKISITPINLCEFKNNNSALMDLTAKFLMKNSY